MTRRRVRGIAACIALITVLLGAAPLTLATVGPGNSASPMSVGREFILGSRSRIANEGARTTQVRLNLGAIRATGGPHRVDEPIACTIELENPTSEAIVRRRVALVGGPRGRAPVTLGAATVDIAPGRTARATITWVADAPGRWEVQAVAADAGPSSTLQIEVLPEPAADPDNVLGAQGLPVGLAGAALALLAVAFLLAGRSAIRLFGR